MIHDFAAWFSPSRCRKHGPYGMRWDMARCTQLRKHDGDHVDEYGNRFTDSQVHR